MTTMATEAMEPDDGEVLQEEAPELGTIPVEVVGPVRTQGLPAKAAGMRRYTLGPDPFRVLPADPRRRSVQIQAYDPAGTAVGVFLGTTRGEVTAGTAARLTMVHTLGTARVSPVLTLGATDEVWVAIDGAGAEVSVFGEQWAE